MPLSTSEKRIPGLDGLRGIAATIVLMTHTSNNGYFLLPGVNLSGTGRSGVLLFFVLSAFLLTSQVLAWNSKEILRWSRWQRYLEARVLRIWPLFLVVLLFSLFTTYLNHLPWVWRLSPLFDRLPVPMTLSSFIAHVRLEAGEDILWTIPVEFKFYLVLPLLLLLLLLPQKATAPAIRVVLPGLVLASFYLMPVTLDDASTFPFIGVFLLGVTMAFITFRDKPLAAWARRAYETVAWACLAVWVFCIPSVFSAVTGSQFPIAENENHPIFAPLWGLLIVCMLRGTGGMRRLLDSRVFVLAGTLSYSLYLWHRIPIHLMSRLESFGYTNCLPISLRSWLIVAAAFLIAYVSYAIVERPVQRWRSRRARAMTLSLQPS